MKILHFSDLHLDSQFTEMPIEAKIKVRRSIQSGMSTILNGSLAHDVDGLIISGDLFDHGNARIAWIQRLSVIFETILESGRFVAYATGNHDYWIQPSHFQSLLHYPTFALFAQPEMRQCEFHCRGKKWAIAGIGYNCEQPGNARVLRFPTALKDAINIGVFHGVVTSDVVSEEVPYYAMSKLALEGSQYDYIALGHVHRQMRISDRIAYSGQAMPVDFTDLDCGAGLSVDLSSPLWEGQALSQCIVKPFPLPLITLKRLEVEVFSDSMADLELVLSKAVEKLRFAPNDFVLRLVLTGSLSFMCDDFDLMSLMMGLFEEDAMTHQIVNRTQFNFPNKNKVLPLAIEKELGKQWDLLLTQSPDGLDPLNGLNFLRHVDEVREFARDHRETLMQTVLDLFAKELGPWK